MVPSPPLGRVPSQDYRRRVKFLASLLLMVSMLNMLTLSIYVFDALYESLGRDQWLSLLLEVVVNGLGIAVGSAGLQGAQTLDPVVVRKYCLGLLAVGALYIGTDVFSLWRASAASGEVRHWERRVASRKTRVA